MPLNFESPYTSLSLRDLCDLKVAGFSVLKSPHVGNQHPSNLVTAALNLPLRMVSFTIGEKDKNFHPQLLIKQGIGETISCEKTWTPFARTIWGDSLEGFHQGSLLQRFPRLSFETDYEMLCAEPELGLTVLNAATESIKNLWYRRVSESGELTRLRPETVPAWSRIESDIFRLSSPHSGYVVPNRGFILFDLVWQSLASGRDLIYHLSGPQMVGYIGGHVKSLSRAYDNLRRTLPALPETLRVRVVPVASARFVTHVSREQDLRAVEEVIVWYENLPRERRQYAKYTFAKLVERYPEFTRPIESAECLSQYDLRSADDLVLSDWMLEAPLSRVEAIHRMLSSAPKALAHAA